MIRILQQFSPLVKNQFSTLDLAPKPRAKFSRLTAYKCYPILTGKLNDLARQTSLFNIRHYMTKAHYTLVGVVNLVPLFPPQSVARLEADLVAGLDLIERVTIKYTTDTCT